MDTFPIFSFPTEEAFAGWLDTNHTLDGIWLRFYKKNSHITSLTYDQALDVALCYGWIDSQVKKYDEISYIQKFTPRRGKSIWSKRNTQHITRLIKEGKMKSSGLLQVEQAKKDGRWKNAYHSASEMLIPSDLSAELSKLPKAQKFFESLTKANRYAITWRLQTAKTPQTRARRLQTILTMLENGESFHKQKT